MNTPRASHETERRRIGAGKLLLAALVFVLALLTVLFFVWQRRVGLAIEQELTRLHAAGEPVTVPDMEAFYALPEGREDCTQLYLDACTPLDITTIAEASEGLPSLGENPGQPAPEERWAARESAETCLARYQNSLDLLHEAARRGGGARYPVDFHATSLNSAVSALNHGYDLLILEAKVRSHHRDAHGASQSLIAAWRLGESFEAEPGWMSQLLRSSFSDMALEEFARLFEHLDFSDEDIRIWQRELRSPDYPLAVRRAARSERALGLLAIQRQKPFMREQETRWSLRLVGNSIQMRYLDRMNQLVAASDEPWPQSRAAMLSVWRGMASDSDSPWWSPIQSALAASAPGYSLVSHIGFYPAARARSADTALAAVLFYREHGHILQKIDALVPAFLSATHDDPFSGLPLHMIVRDDEVIVYSVGEDGVDDGAVDAVPFQHVQPDLPFRLKLRPIPGRSPE